jgi:hypothetical protein
VSYLRFLAALHELTELPKHFRSELERLFIHGLDEMELVEVLLEYALNEFFAIAPEDFADLLGYFRVDYAIGLSKGLESRRFSECHEMRLLSYLRNKSFV